MRRRGQRECSDPDLRHSALEEVDALGKCHQRLNYTPSTTARQLHSRTIIFKGSRMGKGRKLQDANVWRSASLKIELNVPGMASI